MQGPAYASEKGHLNCWFQQKHTMWSAALLYKKTPQTWSLFHPCTCMCREGDRSHQTPRARDKWGSPLPGSRNQTPCSCMCTSRSSLTPFRLGGQVYFSKPFTNLSCEKIDPRNPWSAGKENITGWSDVCLRELQATSTSHIWSCLFISEESYLDSKNGGWSLLQTITPHPATALKSSSFKGVFSWQHLLGPRGAMAPTGTSWGPKHLLSFSVCSGWHRQGPFHIWCLHTESWLKGFCGGSKIELFYLTPVSQTQSAKAVRKHFQICLQLLVPSLLLLLLSRDFPKRLAHSRQRVHLLVRDRNQKLFSQWVRDVRPFELATISKQTNEKESQHHRILLH